MLIVVSGEGITCLEPDRTDRLQVDVRAGVSDELVRSQLSSLGLMDGTHVWLDVEQIRALSGLADDVHWAERFEGMLRYARNRGWLREAALLRAHLTRADVPAQGAPTQDETS
ncbi:MAG: hypothetical protein ACRDPY_46175 [Streptosporangiaceae bacterium]